MARSLALGLLLATIAAAQQRPPQGITKAQASEIISELRAIHLLLLRMSGTSAAPGAEAKAQLLAQIELPAGTPAIGLASAPAAMVEFTDLQCPNCRDFEAATFPAIRRRFIRTGKLRFYDVDLPLPMHRYAMPAAVEQLCAGEQGRFWRFRSAVLLSSQVPAPGVLDTIARKLSLDQAHLAACTTSHRYDRVITENRMLALRAGIYGTPTFIIGRASGRLLTGKRIRGAQPLSVFVEAIEKAIAGHTTPGLTAHGQ